MTWAKEARNSIEKKGDLETFSQIKCRIIASYFGGPETEWLPQDIFSSPGQLHAMVPRSLVSQKQIYEHGTLLIERRWIDKNLPHTEVLDALVHVYDEFRHMLFDLHRILGLQTPTELSQIAPPLPQPLLMDRALYLSVKTGGIVGTRYITREVTDDEALLRKRYKRAPGWNKVPHAKSFREICDIYFSNARAVMTKDGFHRPLCILFRGNNLLRIISMDHPDRASRYVLVRELAQIANRIGADAVMLISEAWTSRKEDLPPSGYAVDAENRGEALILNAGDSNGNVYMYDALVVRKKNKRHKIKKLEPTKYSEEGLPFILVPFQDSWNCLDIDKLKELSGEIPDWD